MTLKVIYVVGVSAMPVKVGMTSNLEKRLKHLQIGNPDPLRLFHMATVPGRLATSIELGVHAALADRRRLGEWFDVSAEEATAKVKEIADAVVRANPTAPQDDILTRLADRHAITENALEAVSFYRDRLSRPDGRLTVESLNKAIYDDAGAAGLTLFLKVIVERKPLSAFATWDTDAYRNAERLLAAALNALAKAYSRACGVALETVILGIPGHTSVHLPT